MKRAIILLFILLIISASAEAGQFYVLVGGDKVTFNIDEALHTTNRLYSLGIEYRFDNSLSLGFSFSFSDIESDNAPDSTLKADCYLKYNFRPNQKLDPFIAAGISTTSIKYQASGLQSGNNDAEYYVQNGFDSHSIGSVGGVYQVGIAFNLGRRLKLETFWSQYAGTNSLVLNIIGIRYVF